MVKTVAILTDFGYKDAYVGVMKGVMLGINSKLNFVDVSNEIEPFNILSAAYVLYTAWDYFPEDTTFLAVVDPGVGSSRKILISCCDNKYLVTPDNGTVSMLERMKKNLVHYNIDGLVLEKVLTADNNTFHGRSIFAPLAANIATYGIDFVRAKKKTVPVVLDYIKPEPNPAKGTLRGRIMHIDRFGNCVTNVFESDIRPDRYQKPSRVLELHISGHTIHGLCNFFSEAEPGKPLCYIGSSGFLEIGVREGSACKVLKLKNNVEFLIKNLINLP